MRPNLHSSHGDGERPREPELPPESQELGLAGTLAIPLKVSAPTDAATAALPVASSAGLVVCGCVMVAASLALRFSLFDFQSGDYRAFLSNWYDSFLRHGRWHGLGDPATHFPGYCYPPLYLYLISLSTLLPVPKLYAIKLLSVAAEYVAAWYAWRLGCQAGFSPARSLRMVAAVLFLPTVVLNSALWGQCDMMYACVLLASLYYVLEGRTAAALVAFGLSISVKPQAMIWCPFLAGLLVSGRLPWRQLWIAPSVYITCAVPAMLAGQPVLYALGCWVRPAVAPTTLVQGAPNWCLFMSPDVTAGAYAAGVLLTVLTTAALIWWMWRTRLATPDLDHWLVSAALLSALLLPFMLPGMHERYFFAADVLSVVYAFYDPRRWFVPVLIQFASGFSYYPYLFGREPVPRLLLAAAMALAIECVAIRMVQLAAIRCNGRKGGIL